MSGRCLARCLMPLAALALAACSPAAPELRGLVALDGERLAGDGYEQGKAHLAAGRLGLAATAFQGVLAREGESVATLNALAATYDSMGRFDLADRYYRQALAIAPSDPQTLNNAGYSLYLRGRLRLAVALLTDAWTRQPGNPVVGANLDLARRAYAAPATADKQAEAATPVPVPRVWIERSSRGVQTLVVADETFVQAVTLVGAPPRLASHLAGEAHSAKAPAAAPRPCRVEVSNGAGRRHMGARMRAYLRAQGIDVARLTNDASFAHGRTVIFHRPGFDAEARALAARLPVPVEVEAAADLASDVRLRLGGDLLPFDGSLENDAQPEPI